MEVKLGVKYSKVLSNAQLKEFRDLVGFLKLPTGWYQQGGVRWLWAKVDDESPEINKELIHSFVFEHDGKVEDFHFFVRMDYDRLFEPVPSFLPNGIKTYTNLVNWNGNMEDMPEDKGEPIYKTWVEYFEGTSQEITCNSTKTFAYVNSNLWGGDLSSLIRSLVTDGYEYLDSKEYRILLDNNDIWDYRITAEQMAEQLAVRLAISNHNQ